MNKCPICKEELPTKAKNIKCFNFENWDKERLVDFLEFINYNYYPILKTIYDDYDDYLRGN